MKWRTLIRVVTVENNAVVAQVPGWDIKRNVNIPLTVFPAEVHTKLKKDTRFYAKANVDAMTSLELVKSLENIEL